MDYFILTQRKPMGDTNYICYVCVNSITRSKDASGKDVTTFISSGIVYTIPTEEVIAITSITPSSTAVAGLL